MALDMTAYAGRRVLVTGHTGFKGSWLCWMLADAGAQVTGYALEPPTDPGLFALAGIGGRVDSRVGDIRNFEYMRSVFLETQPEYVFHLAAQPIVRDSYDVPRYTFETNVMGTVNLLECVRTVSGVLSVLNVTTDKVYLNDGSLGRAFREDDPLDGFDPYSNSKSCSELVTHSYARSFFGRGGKSGVSKVPCVSTARAGNVIGGGDFAAHRIVPDAVRSALAGEPLLVRNPDSVRPFQHVIEPLAAYLEIAQAQEKDASVAGWYNVGPADADCATAGQIAQLWCDAWGDGASWVDASAAAGASGSVKPEAALLRLDSGKLEGMLGWKPRWDISRAVRKTAEWTRVWASGGDVGACMSAQIREYLNDSE